MKKINVKILATKQKTKHIYKGHGEKSFAVIVDDGQSTNDINNTETSLLESVGDHGCR